MIGTTISHYRILEKLGEGGMGVVYKALDTHLDRWVALKVLPGEKVSDADRRRRFVQEAKAASSLNHPHIVTIHDIDETDGVHFIVMEYVQGKTLDQLIPRHGMQVNEALKISVQMADALAAAHVAGIVHRDLKPANVIVSENGLVKILDFGLAKLTEEPETGKPDAETLQFDSGRTEEGTILGTVSYMSPEQAEGKKIDARSDIFSLGSVLYELTTGQRAFQGDSRMSTLAAILNKDPTPVTELSKTVPYELEKIIGRCLRKAPDRRWQHMADLKVAIEDLKEASASGKLVPATVTQRSRWSKPIWTITALALLVAAAVALWFSRFHPEAPKEPMTVLPLTSYPGFEDHASFSPDGNQVAFSWNGDKQDNPDIYVKLIGGGPPLRLTSDPARDFSPAWSPDGRFIAFVRRLSSEKLAVLLVPALGGPERTLGEASDWSPRAPSDLAWSPNDKFLAISDKGSSEEPVGLFLLSVETGEKRRLTSPPGKFMGDSNPAFSPDGHTLAFTRSAGYSDNDLYLLGLSDSGTPVGEPKRLTFEQQGVFGSAWTPDGRDIIFSSGGLGAETLWRVPAFESGKPRRLLLVSEGGAHYQPTVSRQGHRLAYTVEHVDENIWRLDVSAQGKTGTPTSFISSTRVDGCPQFSPDGKRLAFSSGRSSRSGGYEVWICNRDGSGAVQLTSMGAEAGFPRWSPDGKRIAFDSNAERQFDIYVIGANGGKPEPLTSSPSTDAVPSWSRDGKWIYFGSDRSGEYQIWKMPSSGVGPTQVTQKGGTIALESPDGKSIYYTKTGTLSSLWKVPVGGGEETEVLASVFRRCFAVVDKGIYYISAPSADSDCRIEFFDFASEKSQGVAAIGKIQPYSFTASPDGQSFLYSQYDSLGSDLMLVENFH